MLTPRKWFIIIQLPQRGFYPLFTNRLTGRGTPVTRKTGSCGAARHRALLGPAFSGPESVQSRVSGPRAGCVADFSRGNSLAPPSWQRETPQTKAAADARDRAHPGPAGPAGAEKAGLRGSGGRRARVCTAASFCGANCSGRNAAVHGWGAPFRGLHAMQPREKRAPTRTEAVFIWGNVAVRVGGSRKFP